MEPKMLVVKVQIHQMLATSPDSFKVKEETIDNYEELE